MSFFEFGLMADHAKRKIIYPACRKITLFPRTKAVFLVSIG